MISSISRTCFGERSWAPLFLAFALTAGALSTTFAQEPLSDDVYQLPPQDIVDIVDAPPAPAVRIAPNHKWMLLLERPNLPPIEELAMPELRLGGLRLNPRTNGSSRSSYASAITLKSIADGNERTRTIAGIPAGARIENVEWAPNSRRFAFTLTFDDHIELWGADVDGGAARRLTAHPINDALGTPYYWLSDGNMLVCRLIPADRRMPPEQSTVPKGPIVQENLDGQKAAVRTFQDLLGSPYDEDLFDYYLNTRIALVDVVGKQAERMLGAAGPILDAEPSPDGRYLLVQTLHRPYSYLVPFYRFPRLVEVWDMSGNVVHQAADLPLAENVPVGFGAVETAPRSFSWRSDAPATLVWVEARDGGDPMAEAEIRDEVFIHPAPFSAPPVSLVRLAQRFGGVQWGNGETALVYDWWWKTRNQRMLVVAPDRPGAEPRVLFDRSWENRYEDPGSPVSTRNQYGRSVLRFADEGTGIYMTGEGASPEGNRPFIDRLNLDDGSTTRLFRSEAPYYENIHTFLDDEGHLLLTRRESPTDYPNYYARDLRDGSLRALTDFAHPYPHLKNIKKELIRYERADGVQLTATLYLPPDYKEGDGPLPTLLWAYPQEFKSADAAGQVTDSPYRFVYVGWWSPLPMLTQGYAILDDPSMPIIGEGDQEPNDRFVEQLVSSAQAAVDEVVRRGVTDRDRVAIAGHSYGAFMTANLLAHSDIFRAGIARSGAYNRTLTPFGFQSEERTFWQAPEVYIEMSPFTSADRINEPILLIHGQADNNSGTFPMQSERLYQALKGLGGTARLVILPHESHGYRARESVLHVFREQVDWLDRYVKNASPRTEGAGKASTGEEASAQ